MNFEEQKQKIENNQNRVIYNICSFFSKVIHRRPKQKLISGKEYPLFLFYDDEEPPLSPAADTVTDSTTLLVDASSRGPFTTSEDDETEAVWGNRIKRVGSAGLAKPFSSNTWSTRWTCK